MSWAIRRDKVVECQNLRELDHVATTALHIQDGYNVLIWVNLMNRHLCAWLWTLLALGLLPLPSAACDCFDPGLPCKAFVNTPTVFTGRVVKISVIKLKASSGDDYPQRFVAFDVERSYRGWEGKTAEVVTGMGGGD